MKINTGFWIKFSLINLFLVAVLGTYLRLKISVELPLIQKNILHAHSHFAFSGWIGHALMVLLIYAVKSKLLAFSQKKYSLLIAANLVSAYGMLISFLCQGYGAISISFSTLSIFVFYLFAYVFYKDTKHLKQNLAIKWFHGALLFGVLSSFGTFFLAYTLTTKNINFDAYLASIYFYLHFQYNGWFLFACIGLFFSMFTYSNKILRHSTIYFYTLLISTFVTYVLSVLWLNVSQITYWITTVFALLQLIAWLRLQNVFLRNYKNEIKNDPLFLQIVLLLVAICVTLKFVLQFLLIIPSLAEIVFGIRSIVIAFLHLVLLGIISLFILYYVFAYNQKIIIVTKFTRFAILFFVVAVFMNEFFLSLQGFYGFRKRIFPNVNELLLVAAFLLLTSSALLAVSVLLKGKAIDKK